MRGPSTKVQAIFLLILLCGHEAKRIQDDAKVVSLSLETTAGMKPNQWEKELKKMDKKCSWEPRSGYCFGKGCGYEYFLLDTGNHVCKKSDDYFLKNKPSESVKMFAEILKAKSEKYKLKCQGSLSFMNPWCKRRLQQIFRAVRFLALAQEELGSSESNTKELGEAFSASMSSMANTFGKDGKLVQKLKAQAESSGAMYQYPKEATEKMLLLIKKLTQGSQKEHDEAEEEIERSNAFESIGEDLEKSEAIQRSNDFDAIDTGEAIERSNAFEAMEDEESEVSDMDLETDAEEKAVQEFKDTVASQLRGLEPEVDAEDAAADGSSALEVADERRGLKTKDLAGALLAVIAVGAAIFVTVALAKVVVGALIAYAVLSVFSCGLFHVGVWYGSNQQYTTTIAPVEVEDAKETNDTSAVAPVAKGLSKMTTAKKILTCTGKFLLLPAKLVYVIGKYTIRGVKYLYRKAKGNSTKASKASKASKA